MALRKRLRVDTWNEETVLCCPTCGLDYLHHSEVEVFSRETEDAEHGLHLTVREDNVVAQDTRQAGNPSSRRDGIRIFLWCEGCEATVELTLAQHKGRTFVRLTAAPPEGALAKIKTRLAAY